MSEGLFSRLKNIGCFTTPPGSWSSLLCLSVTASMLISASLSSSDSIQRVSLKMLFSGIYIVIWKYQWQRLTNFRALWSLFVIGLLFVFKFLLCNKLDDISKLDFSEVREQSKADWLLTEHSSQVMSPVFILLQLIMIRACQLNQKSTRQIQKTIFI